MNSAIIYPAATPLQAAAQKLEAKIQGQVILPGAAGYDEARMAWNSKVEQFPAVIVVANNGWDVAAAVGFARQYNLGVAVQATGHGSVRPADDCLLILTQEMRGLEIDAAAQTARIEAGVKWGDVLAAAQQQGLAPLLGSSPTVGAVGFTLGGGLGWLSRKYGLSADNVVEFDLITADGLMHTASATQNSDLFWGLRGGGGSLGIVTSMTIRLFPVTQVYAGNLYYPIHMAHEVFRRYRAWIAAAPDELTSSVLIMNFPPFPELPEFLRGRTFAMLRGCYCGPVSEGERLLQDWRTWCAPVIDDFKAMPFSAVPGISSDPIEPLPRFNSGAWLRELSDVAIDVLVRYGVGIDGPSPLVLTEVRHAGGAIQRVGEKAAVYGNRESELLMSLVGVSPSAAHHQLLVTYTAMLKEALRPYLTGGVYMNFLEGIESQQRIRDGLAAGGYARLAQLKAQIDPENVIRYSFNVSPAYQDNPGVSKGA